MAKFVRGDTALGNYLTKCTKDAIIHQGVRKLGTKCPTAARG